MSILKRNYNLDKFSLKRGLSDSLVMQIKSEVEFHLQELLDMENEGPETEVIFPKK